MKVHKISQKEWMGMDENERITVLEKTGISYREAWELSECERVSDLPGELLPLHIQSLNKKKKQRLYKNLQLLISSSNKPLHTAEIACKFDDVSHHRILMALIYLMNESMINGRLLDVAKGIWIWWPKNAFSEVKN